MQQNRRLLKDRSWAERNPRVTIVVGIAFTLAMLISHPAHCVLGFLVRCILIIYANFHDRMFSVPYTDVDYRVYTDASRFLIGGGSPFERHTYRYTPLLALILTPNILLHADFGKVLFSAIDVLVAVLIKTIASRGERSKETAKACALVWLYNPLTIVVSTRGNADSLAVLLVLSMLYFLQNDSPVVSGLVHGLSIHFRLYPIAFSLSMYLSAGGKSCLVPTAKQLKLIVSCVFSLVSLTALSYYFYGYRCLHESLVYHLIRKDARHNFSVFFYMTYLSTGQSVDFTKRVVTLAPQLLLLVLLSFRYSTKSELPFAMLTQAIVMVIYNPVMTSQYFFWFLSVLPVCLPNIRMSLRRCGLLVTLWLLGQALWLFDAYLLEFRAVNTFHRVWLDGVFFFVVNVKILQDIIGHYRSPLAAIKDE